MSKFSVSHNDNLLKELNKHGTHHTTTHSKLDIVASNTEIYIYIYIYIHIYIYICICLYI